jgi:hypothetical protein
VFKDPGGSSTAGLQIPKRTHPPGGEPTRVREGNAQIMIAFVHILVYIFKQVVSYDIMIIYRIHADYYPETDNYLSYYLLVRYVLRITLLYHPFCHY